MYRRDQDPKSKEFVGLDALLQNVEGILTEMQDNYFKAAKSLVEQNLRTDIHSLQELKEFFTPKNPNKPEIHGGFVRAKWCGEADSVATLDELKVTIRCLPLDQSGSEGKCVLTGKPATLDAIFAKAY